MGEVPHSIGEVPPKMGEMPQSMGEVPQQWFRCIQSMAEMPPING